ncbi:hypothetical protein OGAPHI_004289 [Ogataea philodendri]|uniref:Uncharacterized protein n=1 Tax=Ogataea philodendri TaxID=1378263 RepID=A0A9P8P6T9_9ASCO|nr:uncharacterized protein OGAPHI_004289 [Ogataea philodendri]KAH3666100.1 hypothetical protein OGAPHI_004289 [Ogataea philodendri]
MFLTLLVLMVIFIALVILLPLLSGLFTYSSNPSYLEKKKLRQSEKSSLIDSDGYGGYVPPDEQIELENNAKSTGSGFYSKIGHLTSEDIPVKLHMKNESGLKKRSNKNQQFANAGPGEYDYDLNELINEELAEDNREKLQAYRPNISNEEV